MNDYCPHSRKNVCIKWNDYMLTRFELEEADTLCHENWEEIKLKTEYIRLLQNILDQYGIPYPDIYE